MSLPCKEDKFFPKHNNIWTYCEYLGPYVEEGVNYDLGIYDQGGGNLSLAAVWGEENSQYRSGQFMLLGKPTRLFKLPIYQEAWRRYNELYSL